MSNRGHIAALLLIPMMLLCLGVASQLVRSRVHEELPAGSSYVDSAPAGAPAAGLDALVPGDPRGDSEPATDLYGNEVTDAVAKYKLDATGSLYELHSPQTELPHLGSPKT